MFGWQRHIKSLLNHVGKRLEHGYTQSANFCSSRSPAELSYLQRVLKPSSGTVSRPFFQLYQQLSISTTRKLLADSTDEAPIRSPLTPVLAIDSGKTEDQLQNSVSKPAQVQAVLEMHKTES